MALEDGELEWKSRRGIEMVELGRDEEKKRTARFEETYGATFSQDLHVPGSGIASRMWDVYQRHLMLARAGRLRELLSRNEKGREDVRCVWVKNVWIS